jgi:hypothetical protein
MTEEEKIKIIEAKDAECVGDGIHQIHTASPEQARELIKKPAAFVMSQPEYEGFELLICESPKHLFEEWKKREGKPVDISEVYGGTKWVHALIYTKILKDIEESYIGIDDHIEQIGALDGCHLAMEGQKTIYMSLLPSYHYTRMVDGQLQEHREDGYCIQWPDGYGLCSIEDFSVPDWVCFAKPEEVTAKMIFDIADVDVRRIAIQKFGVGSLIAEAEAIDDDRGYQVIDLGKQLELEKALYLRMVNPSNGAMLAEGVENHCDTVAKALEYRTGINGWNPSRIDEMDIAGGNLLQSSQGDVCVLALTQSEFEERIKGQPVMERDFVLSAQNQKRHKLVGNGTVYGTEERQWLQGFVTLEHPEHGTHKLTEYVEVWGVMEFDHTKQMKRTVVD